MKALLNNQECRIDNHKAGQTARGLSGLHIHKTFRKNKRFSKAEIRIPLDGEQTKWICTGENAEKLERECRNALKDSKTNSNFVQVVIEEMSKFENTLNSNLSKEELEKKHRAIAENVLTNAFQVENLQFVKTEYKTVYGNRIMINNFENETDTYSSCITKAHSTYRGKSKQRNDKWRFAYTWKPKHDNRPI